MEVGSCVQNQLHPCRRDFVKPLSLVMDDHGSQPHPRSSAGLRVSTKSKAPSPPGLKKLDSPGFSQWYPGNPHLTMEQKENLIDQELSLVVVLPGGVEKMTTVHGSKPLMDLLVTLCAKYHLNPSSHTLELVTSNRKKTKLKPNALIGTVDAEKILLKPKGEDKNKKTFPPMPEATVRMVINYKKTQKTILRVNPRVPLSEHLPAICEKCEFDIESTVLQRDVHSLGPLDMSHSLNDYAIREVYARDTKGPATPMSPVSPIFFGPGTVTPGKDKNQKEEENKGLFSLFRRSKKKSYQATTVSAPASPVLVSKPRPLSMALPSSNSSTLVSPTRHGDGPKKRRAPQPPILVSQTCPSDTSARRRLYSDSTLTVTQLDCDQFSRLSRGSSAESSLKRTKRKAPPPPTSPSPVLQETDPLEENSPGAAAANTLEEIMEQEESTASVKSATASETQGEDGSLNMSADVSTNSPSPDTEIMSTTPVGEDQTRDLSSDGNQLQSSETESATLVEENTTCSTDTSDPANTNTLPCQVEAQPVCEDFTHESIGDESDPLPSSFPPPVTQDAEEQNTETLDEPTEKTESPPATSTSHPAVEDAQAQTDDSPLPVPPPTDAETSGKKDMATSMEETDFKPASETPSCQDPAPSAPASVKSPAIYATNSEPKPKPSNELTRDYIPKVGMTTYTIVPQKSMEKLRYFEVELTLEAPPREEGPDIGSLQLEERAALKGQKETEKIESELHTAVPREDLLTSTTTANTQDTVNGATPEPFHSTSQTCLPKADGKISSPGTSQAGSPTKGKEIKIPPATKPKPGSFRLAQHKKIPGYYVTSAAGKSLEKAKLPPPPSPPPVQNQEETTGVATVPLSPKGDNKTVVTPQITRQSSLPCKEPSSGLSLEKFRSFAAPRPYSPATPSRFAQAVTSAVKRSQSLFQGPRSPVSPSFSPVRSPTSVTKTEEFSELKDVKHKELDGDKDSTLSGVESQPTSLGGIVPMEGGSSP